MKRLRKHRNFRGQMIIDYAITIMAGVAFIAMISLFFQRQLQGTIQNARKYVAGQMADGDDEYEPYYVRKSFDQKDHSSSALEFPGDGSIKVSTGSINESTNIVTITCAENGQCDP